jgi:hypothetical protein
MKLFVEFYIIFSIILLKKINNTHYYNIKLKNKFNLSKELIQYYGNLYSFTINKIPKPNFSRYKIKDYPIREQKGICICVIGKNENLYAKEFVEYYYNLQVDKIFIFDNNDLNGERFDIVLKKYILNKFVEIIDIRGLISIQIPIYNYFYQKYSCLFDWIIFIDFDEYINIQRNLSLKQYLYNKRFIKCQSILLNWIYYDDNGLIKYDNRTLLQRFTNQKFKLNKGKCIIRTQFKNILIPTTMNAGINIKYYCNSNGERIFPKNYFHRKFKNNSFAFIKHFSMKTIEEFCNKIKRGDAHYSLNNPYYKIILKKKIRNFFKINQNTTEKRELLKQCLNN